MSVAATLAPAAPARGAGPDPRHGRRRRRRGARPRRRAGSTRSRASRSSRRCAPAARPSTRSSAHNPDVVVLDIEMPDLDGIEALPLLLEKKRDLVVIMASTLTRRNAEISLRALSLGAADYIPKPATNREVTTSASVPPRPDREDPPARRAPQARRGRSRARRSRRRRRVARPRFASRRAAPARSAPGIPATSSCGRSRSTPPRVLLIGSSTGGPQALTAWWRSLRR